MRDVINARVTSKEVLSSDTSSFVMTPLKRSFANCVAGAHVDVLLPDDLIRNYSLIDWAPQGDWVKIGVKREEPGRGGSQAMHRLEVGDAVSVTQPRNNFPLQAHDGPMVLVGGGIGITPLLAMAKTLIASERPFELFYLVRTRALAAFDRVISEIAMPDQYYLHCDDRHGLFDFRSLVGRKPAETTYYVCGPEVMLEAVQRACEEVDRGSVVFERFAANSAVVADHAADTAFDVTLQLSQERIHVPGDMSILKALRNAGHDVDYACSEGTCGTCILDVLGGEIDHRDSFLTDEERQAGDCMCICVSRAKGKAIVLDL
jgi:vanillate O-demethylase ferredoxin subunit